MKQFVERKYQFEYFPLRKQTIANFFISEEGTERDVLDFMLSISHFQQKGTKLTQQNEFSATFSVHFNFGSKTEPKLILAPKRSRNSNRTLIGC